MPKFTSPQARFNAHRSVPSKRWYCQGRHRQIVGNANGSLATATVNCSFNSQTNTFTFTITNTSPV
jgi:hypothetical protein